MGTLKTTRRKFLSNSALAAATLPFLPLVRVAEGATTSVAPLRLILLLTPFHIPEAFYHPQISATNTGMASAGMNFYLKFANSVLAPLAPFQSDLIIFRGLKYSQGVNSHASSIVAFTGAQGNFPANGSATTKGSSIDNYLYSRMAPKGAVNPFAAGAFSYLFADHLYDNTISINKGNPVGRTDNPLKLYNNLFSNFTPPSGQTPPSATALAITRRQQILDLTQKYLTNLSKQMPDSSASHSVLQSHLTAVQSLSAQIGAPPSTATAVSCTPPAASSITNDPGSDNGTMVPSRAAADFASFTKVITQAFACDITRYGSFKMSDAGDPSQCLINQMPGLTNFSQSTNWHAITHGTSGLASNPIDVQMAQFQAYFMTQAANLLSALKAIPDPYAPSQTLYDNTVVLIGCEGPVQSNNSDCHGDEDPNSDQPFIVAGGCGGYFKMGQLILAGGSKTRNVAHNALLTNIVNTFEKNQQQFNPAYAPNILSQYGDYSFTVSPTNWLSV